MTDSEQNKSGQIAWVDLSVPDAVAVKQFYQKVVGWSSSEVSMGDYDDFCMHPSNDDDPVAGVCHAKGVNKDLPPCWIIYITVENLDQSIQHVTELGGEVILGPKQVGNDRYCVIMDPAGAYCALYEKQ